MKAAQKLARILTSSRRTSHLTLGQPLNIYASSSYTQAPSAARSPRRRSSEKTSVSLSEGKGNCRTTRSSVAGVPADDFPDQWLPGLCKDVAEKNGKEKRAIGRNEGCARAPIMPNTTNVAEARGVRVVNKALMNEAFPLLKQVCSASFLKLGRILERTMKASSKSMRRLGSIGWAETERGKQTPEERKKKKKEEEERKRLEEEEARLRAEEEEKQRIIREREEKRIRKKVEKEELKIRKVELEETRELMQEQRVRLEQLELERRNDYAWKRYFRCDGSPNPSIEKEVNTFMSLWRMDESRLTMEEVMDDSIQSLKLIDELRTLVADVGDNEEDNQTLLTYRRTMHELRQLVHEKLDRATVETFSRAVNYADHETSNLQKTWRNDWIAICIWANLSKNPRIRQFTFSDVDITFDIPKFLTLSDCGFLVSFMKFDNYSVECASYTPHRLQRKTETSHNTRTPDIGEKPPEEYTKRISYQPLDLFAEFGDLDGQEGNDEQNVEAEEVVELPPEDQVPTPEPDEWERAPLLPDAVDLGEYHVIGGVIRFDLLTLPRQPKTGRGWNITTCVRPPKLNAFEYIVDAPEKGSVVLDQTEPTSDSTTEKKDEKKEEKPPVQVRFRLPLCLVIAEEPLLARWDPEVSQWRTTGIELEHFKEDENLIVLRASVFGTMAIFQDSHINMPFQAWELRPLPLRPSQCLLGVPSVSAATKDYGSDYGEQTLGASTYSAPVYRFHGAQRSNQPAAETNKETAQTTSVVDATTTDPSKERPPSEAQEAQCMILGPVPTLGLSDEAYLSELPETNQCVLTITGGLTELRLHILGERISVLPGLPEPSDPVDAAENVGGGENEVANTEVSNHHKHELTHLLGRWFTPDELIAVLQLSGVNVFPREDSVCRVDCLEKNPITEQRLYEQMALLSPAFAFGWSRWNSEADDDTIIVTMVEHVDQEHTVDEDSWKVYAMTRKKVTKLKMREYDETFDPKEDPTQPFHADFYHMCMDIGSEEAKTRVSKIDLKYLKTVRQMLQVTRLAVFS
ncbi:unnamed protein product [Calicophoron daubneyi]|uniref:IC97/Casc1 N-terminal domain-containing protein n=1 Tax=Calicophoron daubneyi TaxID=300641 RepID=A0AAV2SZZ0_CALDB